MAKRTEVNVEIDAAGRVHVEVNGAKGKACLEYLELLRLALGPIESQQATSEMYESAEVEQKSTVTTRTRSKS